MCTINISCGTNGGGDDDGDEIEPSHTQRIKEKQNKNLLPLFSSIRMDKGTGSSGT